MKEAGGVWRERYAEAGIASNRNRRGICVDEKAFRKWHDYVTVVSDMIGSSVE